MIGITESAQRRIDDLPRFYLEERERPEAARRLLDDLAKARGMILEGSRRALPDPRPYPTLAAFGFRWILVRVYWVAWTVIDDRAIVTNVFHVSADIERRATPTIDAITDW